MRVSLHPRAWLLLLALSTGGCVLGPSPDLPDYISGPPGVEMEAGSGGGTATSGAGGTEPGTGGSSGGTGGTDGCASSAGGSGGEPTCLGAGGGAGGSGGQP